MRIVANDEIRTVAENGSTTLVTENRTLLLSSFDVGDEWSKVVLVSQGEQKRRARILPSTTLKLKKHTQQILKWQSVFDIKYYGHIDLHILVHCQ